jgi:hypothetical protein
MSNIKNWYKSILKAIKRIGKFIQNSKRKYKIELHVRKLKKEKRKYKIELHVRKDQELNQNKINGTY